MAETPRRYQKELTVFWRRKGVSIFSSWNDQHLKKEGNGKAKDHQEPKDFAWVTADHVDGLEIATFVREESRLLGLRLHVIASDFSANFDILLDFALLDEIFFFFRRHWMCVGDDLGGKILICDDDNVHNRAKSEEIISWRHSWLVRSWSEFVPVCSYELW